MTVKSRFTVLSLPFLGLSIPGPDTPILSQVPNPKPNPEAVVSVDKARFTVLTSQLLRLEWSEDGRFEDRPSLVFINRLLPVPSFKKSSEGEWLILETDKLRLKYRKGSGKFSTENLEIAFNLNGRSLLWRPGTPDTGNLKGTIRTLDGVKGETELERGLLSRDGWVLIDDSNRPLFDDSDWPWVIPRPKGPRQDWYFFGYGHEYNRALADFVTVAGRIPMPPRFAFGAWWSRYWAYTDVELKELVHEFEAHDVPLDVLVVDMDWHQTFKLRWAKQPRDQAGQPLGWTGYTWDRNYFPDPEGFLQWCKDKGLKVTLNLHPASGIQPHEEKYPEMARAMGIDPGTKRYVPFDIVDKKFASNFLNIVLRPLEKQGVDFWWLDWQQWSSTRIPGVTPTWWLNYVFFTDMERQGRMRPLIMHRWGGLGNHRYQIGFSGDAFTEWETLDFESYFTATAANVGFGYWSHDIGGHQPGPITPELYTRWIQFGAFSPILRTHTTKHPEAERRIWAYPNEYASVMREAFLLRYSLLPYIYTAAREAYDHGISICHPMYYDYPEAEEAYKFRSQYMFGGEMFVAPIASPLDTTNMLAAKSVWIPPGEWIEWYSGTRLRGPKVVERRFALDEIPIYVKAGSIIPMQPKMKNTSEKPLESMILTIFPGESGIAQVYDDDGISSGYQKGECAWTTVRQTRLDSRTMKVQISPTEGNFPGMLMERSYELRLPNSWPPEKVICNGNEIGYSGHGASTGWEYDGSKLTTIIRLPKIKVTDATEVTIASTLEAGGHLVLLDGVPGKLARLRRVRDLLNTEWPKEWSPDILIKALQTGNRISLNPKSAKDELQEFHRLLPEVVNHISKMEVRKRVLSRALAHLDDVMNKEEIR